MEAPNQAPIVNPSKESNLIDSHQPVDVGQKPQYNTTEDLYQETDKQRYTGAVGPLVPHTLSMLANTYNDFLRQSLIKRKGVALQ